MSGVARILLAEDSRSYAAGLRRFLEHDSDLQVVGTCTTVADVAKEAKRLKPDLLILDLELADGNALPAIQRILRARALPILVLSDHATRGTATAAAALGAGALDAQPKRSLSLRDPNSARAVMFRRHVKRLSRAHVHSPQAPRRSAKTAPRDRRAVAAIGICASTGGPPALKTVLSALPADFAIPIFVVQHITKGFLPGLLDWFQRGVRVPVGVATARAAPERGVWFAGDGSHLAFDHGGMTRLDASQRAGYHCPAGDVLLASMAGVFGEHAAAVVLTGMGSDGAEGIAAVEAAGGLTIAQDESTSAIYGMPRAARERGAHLILPLEQIGPTLARLRPVERAS